MWALRLGIVLGTYENEAIKAYLPSFGNNSCHKRKVDANRGTIFYGPGHDSKRRNREQVALALFLYSLKGLFSFFSW
jgi:hypothetical protein